MNTKIKRLSALNYFGGKSRYLDWLYSFFPQHTSYLECFVGGGSVFLNKQPSNIEVINDIDKRLFNFMNVLRNHPYELIRRLELSMYSREEFAQALDVHPDPIEDARRYFVRSQQSFGGQSHGSRRKNSWRTSISESRGGVALDVNKWLGKIDGLVHTVERYRMAIIENRPYHYVKPKFDGPEWFHFDDPPYLFSTRTGKTDYEHEITYEDHYRLALMNNSIQAKVMICGYDNPDYDKWYPEPKWQKIIGPDRATNLGNVRKREIIWINYNPPGASHKLF